MFLKFNLKFKLHLSVNLFLYTHPGHTQNCMKIAVHTNQQSAVDCKALGKVDFSRTIVETIINNRLMIDIMGQQKPVFGHKIGKFHSHPGVAVGKMRHRWKTMVLVVLIRTPFKIIFLKLNWCFNSRTKDT